MAAAWWDRLSPKERDDLFAAIAEWAWREERLRVEIPRTLHWAPHFAYGVALNSTGPVHALHGIVRPCPALVRFEVERLRQGTALAASQCRTRVPRG
ncbi:hypothetical protein [Embleya sp. NBC_00896]|uniref:hypothetical protein n=1 Tax=Embleya sp. NBC_00896 TaxID=2975961 RepID=UPI002F90B9A5|nr:hypothetical protein OG928_33460 [Embleya sp. NBC_00896]